MTNSINRNIQVRLTAERVFLQIQDINNISMDNIMQPIVKTDIEKTVCSPAVHMGCSFTSVPTYLIGMAVSNKSDEKHSAKVIVSNNITINTENNVALIIFAMLRPLLPIKQVAGICSIPCSLSPAKTGVREPARINISTIGKIKLLSETGTLSVIEK